MTGFSQSAGQSIPIRPVCALLGVLGLLLQGSSGGHMWLVEHAHCVEHGDLVHGEAHRHWAATEGDPAEPPTFESASTTGNDEAHEHCALSADRRDALAIVGAAHLEACLDPVGQKLIPHEADAALPAQRYRIAPKHSPPA